MMTLTRRTLLGGIATGLLVPHAQAQFSGQRPGRGPLLGVWSTNPSPSGQQPAAGEVVFYFRIDGLYNRWTGTAQGPIDVIGTWHWDGDGSAVTLKPESHTPSDRAAPEPLGKSYSAKVQIADPKTITLQLPGGPLKLTKIR
jgi:hypothetical protein